jgi:LysR family hydrogen peroxide-inducible transcriptional activator
MTAPTSLRQLQYLVVLSERLNFTRAAEACFVTQSTLSAGLKELEKTLGARLVERDRQNVLMTPIGLEVAQRARAILAATQDLVTVAGGTRKPMTGLLRLGVIPTIAPFLLPPCLRQLRQRYPALRLALREDLTSNLLARLEDGQLDVALIALPFDTDNLLVRELFDDELCVVGLKGDPQLSARICDLVPDMTDRLLLLAEGHCLRDHALIACGTAPRRHAEGVEATSLLTLVQMIESGLGIGLVPEMAIASGLARSPRLVTRSLPKPCPKRTIALVGRRTTTRIADLNTLATVLKSAR